jgi:hypothetical protein
MVEFLEHKMRGNTVKAFSGIFLRLNEGNTQHEDRTNAACGMQSAETMRAMLAA